MEKEFLKAKEEAMLIMKKINKKYAKVMAKGDLPDEIRGLILNQEEILTLVMSLLTGKGFVTKHEKGTYDKADPTAFQIWKIEVGMTYGFTMGDDGVPNTEIVKVKIQDVTWGTEIKIENSVGIYKAYYDNSHRIWANADEGFFDILKRLLFEGVTVEEYKTMIDPEPDYKYEK